MKFMVAWQVHQGKLHEMLAKFAQMTPEEEEKLAGPHVKLLGRWHDLCRGRGVAIFEADDAAAFSKFALAWNSEMDFDYSLVLDDEETRAVGRG